MSCECNSYDCIEVFVNPCNTGTTLNIEANETATWTAKIEFNGVFRFFGVAVNAGQDISIFTKLLNENYTHEFRLYNAAGTLVGCYWLKTRVSFNVYDAPVPPPGNNIWQWSPGISANGKVITSDYFKGEIAPILWIDELSIDWAAKGIIQDADAGTLDFSSIGGVSGNIFIQYRNLPE